MREVMRRDVMIKVIYVFWSGKFDPFALTETKIKKRRGEIDRVERAYAGV